MKPAINLGPRVPHLDSRVLPEGPLTSECAAPVGQEKAGDGADHRSGEILPHKPTATCGRVIRFAQEGDAGAFEFIYQQHSGRVYALCLRMLRDPSKPRISSRTCLCTCCARFIPFAANRPSPLGYTASCQPRAHAPAQEVGHRRSRSKRLPIWTMKPTGRLSILGGLTQCSRDRWAT